MLKCTQAKECAMSVHWSASLEVLTEIVVIFYQIAPETPRESSEGHQNLQSLLNGMLKWRIPLNGMVLLGHYEMLS